MAFKGIFNKGDTEENKKNSLTECEKQVRRINTLEVHLSRLLKFEARLGPLLLLKEQLDAAKTIPPTPENHSTDIYTQKELRRQKEEIEKLKMQVTRLEQVKKQSQRQESNSYRHDEDNFRASYQNQAGNLQTKIERLESNLTLVNQLQADILKQLEATKNHCDELQKRVMARTACPEQPSVQKEIYVDKLFLEKYEQNNNIAQVGIRELSGVLNIGATYGTVPLPGEMNPSSDQEENKESAEAHFEGSEPSGTEKVNSDIPEQEIYSDIPIEEDTES